MMGKRGLDEVDLLQSQVNFVIFSWKINSMTAQKSMEFWSPRVKAGKATLISTSQGQRGRRQR